jgi:2-keto-3-deoxy-L-rhamnonate aldolase RhmA
MCTTEYYLMGAKIKRLLAEGKVVKVFGLGQLCYPKLVEIIGQQGGYDAVWLDHEHTGVSACQLEEAARAARATGLDSFARLYVTDYATAMRPLEAGVGGIMAAQVRRAAEVRDLVQWTKFHPLGQRGVNGTGVDGRYGTLPLARYFQQANEETLLVVQIEHADAIREVEEIAAVPGIDVLFIGPADLSQSLGIPGEWDHPRLWETFERVARAADLHRIHWAILPLNPAFARRCLDLGCKMLAAGMDVWAFQRGLRDFLSEYGLETALP